MHVGLDHYFKKDMYIEIDLSFLDYLELFMAQSAT